MMVLDGLDDLAGVSFPDPVTPMGFGGPDPFFNAFNEAGYGGGWSPEGANGLSTGIHFAWPQGEVCRHATQDKDLIH